MDAGAVDVIKALAEHLSAPVACTYLHNDAFPCDHPLWTGPIGYMGSKAAMRILSEADVILAVGTRLSYFGTLPQYDINYFPKTAKIVQIDINPRHIAKTHPVTVGVCADARHAAEELYRQLKDALPAKKDEAVYAKVKAQLADWYKEIADIADEPTLPGRMHPRKALEVVGKFVTEHKRHRHHGHRQHLLHGQQLPALQEPQALRGHADLRQHRVCLPGQPRRAAGLPRGHRGVHRG